MIVDWQTTNESQEKGKILRQPKKTTFDALSLLANYNWHFLVVRQVNRLICISSKSCFHSLFSILNVLTCFASAHCFVATVAVDFAQNNSPLRLNKIISLSPWLKNVRSLVCVNEFSRQFSSLFVVSHFLVDKMKMSNNFRNCIFFALFRCSRAFRMNFSPSFYFFHFVAEHKNKNYHN